MEASLTAAVQRVMVAAGIKAERDPDEPGIEAKNKLQADIERAVIRHWRKQKAAIKEQASFYFPGRKAELNIGMLQIDDDPGFLADMINLLLRGFIGGVETTMSEVGIGFDPTLTNAEASLWAKRYVGELVKDIDGTTEKAIRRAVADFIDTPGMTLGDLTSQLPFNSTRASMIGTTETTRAYAQGQLETGRRLKEEWPGVRVVKHWYTNNDDIVCPLCGPMNGVEVETSEQFSTPGGEVDAPPLHPNCRCWISTSTRIAE